METLRCYFWLGGGVHSTSRTRCLRWEIVEDRADSISKVGRPAVDVGQPPMQIHLRPCNCSVRIPGCSFDRSLFAYMELGRSSYESHPS